MGTIAEKLTYLINTKSAIKTAIENKGVTVGDSTFRDYASSIANIPSIGGSEGITGDDRINLLATQNWDKIERIEYIDTGYKVRYSNTTIVKDYSAANRLVINETTEYTIINKTAETDEWIFTINENKSFDNISGQLIDQTGTYALIFTPKINSATEKYYDIETVTTGRLDIYFSDTVDFLLIYYAPIYVEEPQPQEPIIVGYYKNISGQYFGSDSVNKLISSEDLDNISFSINGVTYNGSTAWENGLGSSLLHDKRIIDENTNHYANLVIYNNHFWSNDVYNADTSESPVGWQEMDGTCIVFLTEDHISPIYDIFDFYFEHRIDSYFTRIELHRSDDVVIEVERDGSISDVMCGQYRNKGYLLGLPKSDDVQELNNNYHIVASVKMRHKATADLVELKYVDTEISEGVYEKLFMQGIVQLGENAYLYIRVADNRKVVNGEDSTSLVLANGKSTIFAFTLDNDDYTGNNLHDVKLDLMSFTDGTNGLTDALTVVINIPSVDNIITHKLTTAELTENGTYSPIAYSGYSEVTVNVPEANLGTKSITENGTYLASADSLDGYSSVEVNVASSGGGWQPDPLWPDIREMYDNDPLAATYTYRAVYLIAAAYPTTLFKAGARYITSDGYDSGDVLASDYEHTWDETDDMVDSTGAYTRWIKVYATSGKNPYNFNNTPLWVVINLAPSLNGNPTASTTTNLSNCSFLQSVELKNNYTQIGNSAFQNCHLLANVLIPESVTSIGASAFQTIYLMKNITIPSSVTSIGQAAFQYNYGIKELTISNAISVIGPGMFNYCRTMIKISLPNTITSFDSTALANCSSLSVILLDNNFDADINISASTLYSHQVLLGMIAAYKDNSGTGVTRTLTIGATNLAKLTSAEIAVAAAKGLTLA